MSERPVDLLLSDMIEAIDRIEQYISGLTVDAFADDHKTIDAVTRNLEIIGEAARRLPDDFTESRSDIEWHKIIGLRNRIVHAYFGIDPQIIWQIAREDLRVLKQSLSGK